VTARAASTDVLLIGGGVASVRCARTLRREGFDGRITLVGDEPFPPYNRPPLTKELLRDEVPDDLLLAEPESWYERRDIELRTGAGVRRLDVAARRATLSDGSTIGFERCLVATGAEPVVPPIPGAETGLVVRTVADARRLLAAARDAPRHARVVVVGGGLIGVEVASALAAMDLHPIVVEQAHALWAGALGESIAAWARERLEVAGVEVRLGSRATRLEAGAAWIGVERIDAAFSVIGVGVRPRVDLARDAGIAIDDGILTDAEHRSDHPAVWAAGDVARVDGVRFEHWHAARDGGERAARSMLGLASTPPRTPWLFTEVAGTTLDVFGVATAWDEERWVRSESVLALLRGGRLVQLAVIGGAIDSGAARELVAAGASVEQVEASLTADGAE
jgi:NADPH-dependent 2,4-dienoyl-CoA reductase/sulfur reductase-like enzyme